MRAVAIVMLIGIHTTGCASSRAPRPWAYEPRALADTLPIWEPDERKSSLIYDTAYQALFRTAGSDEGPRLNIALEDVW